MIFFEKNMGLHTHTITSDNILCCAETGRVIAVFYNDYDLDALMDQLSVGNYTTEQAAIVLGFKPQTLHKWASTGGGLVKPVRLGTKLRWLKADVHAAFKSGPSSTGCDDQFAADPEAPGVDSREAGDE